MIDQSRVADGRLFATHGDRCHYLGKSASERLRWLSENPGRWRYIEDVLQEAALRSPSVEGATDPEAGQQPTDLSSSPGFRKDGDEEDGVSLVDTPAGDCSPPCQPTSLSPPVEAPPTGGPTKAELPDSATVVISESKGPKTEATLLRAKRRKRGRGGGRQLGKQKLSAENANHGRKLSPERMRIVLDSLAEHRLLSLAAAKAGIHRKTLEYWINRSAAGDPGYDVEWQGLIGDFTNTAHQRSLRPTTESTPRRGISRWAVLSTRPIRTETVFNGAFADRIPKSMEKCFGFSWSGTIPTSGERIGRSRRRLTVAC